MTRSLTAAVVVAAAGLAACGGSDSGQTTTPPSTSAAVAAAGTATTAGAATTAGTPTTPRAAAVDICELLTRRDLARAFGGHTPAPVKDSGSCYYERGKRELLVSVRSGIGAPDPGKSVTAGQRRVSGSGYSGIGRTFIDPKTGKGAQNGVTILKGKTLLSLVLTDLSKRSGTLMTPVIRLARAAARRLAAGGVR